VHNFFFWSGCGFCFLFGLGVCLVAAVVVEAFFQHGCGRCFNCYGFREEDPYKTPNMSYLTASVNLVFIFW
jgi:hypothetical protein